jgi:GT2 family glycosyltransferase
LGGLLTVYNPAYGEDWDLGYRAWKSGYEIVFEPKAIVEHYHEQGALKKRYSAFYRRAIAFRNQNIFMVVNITDWKLLLRYLIFLPYHLIYKFDFSFWYGFLLFIFKLPESLKLRKQNMHLFVKSDKEIINLFSSEFEAKNEELF